MSPDPQQAAGIPRLERLLAVTLDYGTWLASAVVAVGLAASLNGGGADAASSGTPVVAAGIALFILLPVLRVVMMLVAFLRDRDYRFGAVAALVLLIICLGFLLGSMSVLRV